MAPNEIQMLADKMDAIHKDVKSLRHDLESQGDRKGYFERLRDVESFALEHQKEHANFRKWLMGMVATAVGALVLQAIAWLPRLIDMVAK